MEEKTNNLINVIEDLEDGEKEVLYNLISKIHKRGKIDEFSIIHTPLKTSLEEMLEGGFLEFQEMASASLPIPLINEYKEVEKIKLPQDYINLPFSLDKVLKVRSSKRDYTGEGLTLQELSTLLYFSYGIRKFTQAYNTDRFPVRMSPSSGGLQAIELYIVINKVGNIKKGIYHYNPLEHSLELIYEGNFRRKMVNLCVKQEFIHNASVVIILSCVMKRLVWKYKIRAYRYTHMDAGFVGQNIYLVSTALRLGVCAIAGFFDDELNKLLKIDGKNEFITLLLSIGKVKRRKE